MVKDRPTLGLALSGSGNRTAFYIGFLEYLKTQEIQIHYITAMSGGSLAAAAFACGSLDQLKKITLNLNSKNVKKYFVKANGHGGLYSLDLVEEEMRNLTQGKNFEDVRPIMTFIGVDVESGELLEMCMGDIARAARVSCTLPGIFEPVKWGNKTLVDGGLLSQVPTASLKKFQPDVTIGINMRGTKHIFTERQISLKKIFNFIKKILFLDEIGLFVNGVGTGFFGSDLNKEKELSIFSILGKSMDLAIKANQNAETEKIECDLLITPNIPKLKRSELSEESMMYYYELGMKTAKDYLPKILQLLEKGKIYEKQP